MTLTCTRHALSAGVAGFALLLAGPLTLLLSDDSGLVLDWRTGHHASANLAPDPALEHGPVVMAFAARAVGRKGAFGVHTWLATKAAGERYWQRHEVVAWGLRHGEGTVRSWRGTPDAAWYGSPPELLVDIRGERAAELVERVRSVALDYPYDDTYRIWPGPNSNTFVAWVARQVPELELALPNTAIGKDWLVEEALLARAPSGTGWQLSLFGALGVTVAEREGIEFNLLGLNFGLDAGPGVKIPGVGRRGW